MLTNLLVLLRTLETIFKTSLSRSVLVSFLFCFLLLAAVLCLPVLEIIWYFSPLTFSAGMCFMAVYRFMVSENFEGEREVTPAEGSVDEHCRLGVAWMNDKAECRIDIDDVELGCFQMEDLKNETAEGGWEEDGGGYLAEKLGSLIGKLEAGDENSGFSEDEMSFQIDRLAEGLWNCYFGRYSSWNYKGTDADCGRVW